MITVGVVIPAYNRREALSKAIGSVLAQTRLPGAIVVVDDASNPAIDLSEFTGASVRLILLRVAVNGGAAAARQAGIDALSTSHVAFLDSDDTWLPDKLECQLAILDSAPDPHALAITCGWRYRFDDGTLGPVLVPRTASHLTDFASGCWFCPGSCVLMSRTMLQNVGGFDGRLRRLEDLDLFVRFSQAGGSLQSTTGAGAIIRRGYNGKMAPVEHGAKLLMEKFGVAGPCPLPRAVRRRLRSWLAVERAVAARNEGRYLRMTGLLSLSFALAPRTRLHLENWWSPPPT
jgi:GT2 family glycosyltransferase